MELISIIVPVYQVEGYLRECIDSLINQTYENIEILLIDDGSTDKSGEICDEYAKKDNRIRVIHQSNKGLSGARNTGLKIAGGEYIAFVDSDDIVSYIYVETLFRILKENMADISVCGYIKSDNANIALLDDAQAVLKTEYIEAQKLLRQWHGKYKKIETVVWNKLYKREILINGENSIIFPEGKIHEDIYVSHLMVANAKSIVITDEKLYLYRMRKSSITKAKITDESKNQDLEAQKARMKYFKDKKMYGSYLRCLKGHLLHRVKYFLVIINGIQNQAESS